MLDSSGDLILHREQSLATSELVIWPSRANIDASHNHPFHTLRGGRITSENGTKRKCRNARVFPKLGVDRLCHRPADHSRPCPQGALAANWCLLAEATDALQERKGRHSAGHWLQPNRNVVSSLEESNT